ncbi:hypothetical protein GCM10017779_61620 [Streptomyces capillispiralis]|nr:hypothetical protein GCM10017779_61620 [Streptomyces capillispiralis]
MKRSVTATPPSLPVRGALDDTLTRPGRSFGGPQSEQRYQAPVPTVDRRTMPRHAGTRPTVLPTPEADDPHREAPANPPSRRVLGRHPELLDQLTEGMSGSE